MLEDSFVSVGPHRLGEDGDIGVIILNGKVETDHLLVMQPRSVAMFQRYGYVLIMIDARSAQGMSPEARRIAGDLSRQNPMPSATAIYGANLLTRTLAILVFGAMAMLSNQTPEQGFFKTEAESRAWLAVQREKLRARRKSP